MAPARAAGAPTTPSSSAAAGTGWPRRTTWPRGTGSPTSPCSSAAGSAAATWGATRRSSAPTTCGTRARRSTSTRSSSGRGCPRSSTTTSCSASAASSTSRTTSATCARAMRRVDANRLNGVDAEWLDADGVREVCPIVDTSPDVRYPVLGATYQPRGGIAKHDHVAWGYARAADALGVRHRPGLRGDRPGDRRRAHHGRAHVARSNRRRARRAGGGRPLLGPRGDGRACAAGAVAPAAGARLRAARAGARLRRDVQRRARLRQPGAQGRARDGRRDRRVQLLRRSAARCT